MNKKCEKYTQWKPHIDFSNWVHSIKIYTVCTDSWGKWGRGEWVSRSGETGWPPLPHSQVTCWEAGYTVIGIFNNRELWWTYLLACTLYVFAKAPPRGGVLLENDDLIFPRQIIPDLHKLGPPMYVASYLPVIWIMPKRLGWALLPVSPRFPSHLRKKIRKLHKKKILHSHIFLRGLGKKYFIIRPNSQHKNWLSDLSENSKNC